MKKTFIILGLFLILFCPIVQADDVTLSVDQLEYYFLTGQQAVISLTVNNTFDKNIAGQLKNTITREVNQGGVQYSSSNSQSQTFTAELGNHTIGINFGTSQQPLTLIVDLTFSFTEQDSYEVELDNIKIYFVSNESQMNNQQNTQSSSSQEITNAQPSNNQQTQPQTPQQKLQNNQLSQDSNALKDQIQKQLQQQQQMEQQFEQNLFNNSKFQEYQQNLTEQGYQLSEKQLEAQDNDSGDFNLTYENTNGETANLQGSMKDGEIEDIQKQTAEDRQQMLDMLNQSTEFQEFQDQLGKEGFNKSDVSFNQQGNQTDVDITYQNDKNETATIHAEFEDDVLKEVRLEREEPLHLFFYVLPIILCIIFVIIYLYYRYKKRHEIGEPLLQHTKKPFDYRKEAERLLIEAKKLFEQGRYKDAYMKAGQSLRLYLSYEHGLQKELTNEEVLNYLKKTKKSINHIKECFNLCSLVEFAKYQANDKDFDQISITVAKTIAG